MIEQLPSKAIDFDEVVVFHNPASTNGRYSKSRIQHKLERLESLIPIHYVETSENPEEMLDIYTSEIDPEIFTITSIIGGDGIINEINEIRSTVAYRYPRTALQTMGGGGYANLFKSSISKELLDSPDLVLELGEITSLSTLDVEISTPDGEVTIRQAVSSFSVNAVSEMIDPINQEYHRASLLRKAHLGRLAFGKYLADGPVILESFLFAKPSFRHRLEDNQETSSFDIHFMNTPFIGGLIRVPRITLDGLAHYVDIPKKRNYLKTVVDLRSQSPPGFDLTSPVTIRPLEDVVYQIDGETREDNHRLYVPANSTIKVSQNSQPAAIVTKLN